MYQQLYLRNNSVTKAFNLEYHNPVKNKKYQWKNVVYIQLYNGKFGDNKYQFQFLIHIRIFIMII